MNRHEASLFPERLDDSISEENSVRFVDALDLAPLGFQRVTAAATGRPAYHPGDLLQLYLYGYLYRLRSSRRLEQETHRNVELMWLLKKLRPDHKTMAHFRRDHLPPLRQVCCALKRWWDAGYVFMRGREKVQAECSLTVLSYNLRRVLTIVGVPPLMAALGCVGRVLGRAALADVQEALLSDRWPERNPKMGLCGSQCGWAV